MEVRDVGESIFSLFLFKELKKLKPEGSDLIFVFTDFKRDSFLKKNCYGLVI